MIQYSFEPILALENNTEYSVSTEPFERGLRTERARTSLKSFRFCTRSNNVKPLTKATARILQPIKLQDGDRLELTLQKDGEAFTARIYSTSKDSVTGKEIKGLASWGGAQYIYRART